MKALAAGRRSKRAPLILLLLSLFLTGWVYAALSPAADAETGSAGEVKQGEALFQSNCSTCHGNQGQGTDIGPSLIGVGAASADFQLSTGRMPMAANAPQAPVKTPTFTSEEIAAMSAFVGSLGPGPHIPTDDQVDPAKGNAAKGMQLFRTNCAMCHNAVGAGGALSRGKVAPPLYEVTPREIYEAMLTGPQSMPVFNEASVTPEGKRDIIAYLVEQRDPSPGGLSLGSLGPVSEGLWVWVIGLGSLIGLSVWIGAKSS
ncbi:ubiquinol-cytochrome c reductase cytochrome c subunit [Bowdeniella nasicola]|uniref:Cytochrome bc1 complex cytochrome c subunit n=1 Tax=Bowdeniella nasicola TaxID=208480 RepID=A0A1H3WBH3_9ACTO|nr:cytochrome c [Bowdeniella nasicola]SDZ84463.1 ubiquinol-cytochrome c reductase cytochrome c subunit [Bowdeniella nasicola]